VDSLEAGLSSAHSEGRDFSIVEIVANEATLKSNLIEVLAESECLRTSIDGYKDEVKELEGRLASSSSKYEELFLRHKEDQAKIVILESELVKLQNEFLSKRNETISSADHEKKIAKFQADLELSQRAVDLLSTASKMYKDEIGRLELQLSSSRDEVAELKISIGEQNSLNQSTNSDSDVNKDELSHFQCLLKESEQRVEEMLLREQALRSDLEKCKLPGPSTSSSMYSGNLDHLLPARSPGKSSLSVMISPYIEDTSMDTTSDASINMLRAEIEKLTANCEELKSDNIFLKDQLSVLRRDAEPSTETSPQCTVCEFLKIRSAADREELSILKLAKEKLNVEKETMSFLCAEKENLISELRKTEGALREQIVEIQASMTSSFSERDFFSSPFRSPNVITPVKILSGDNKVLMSESLSLLQDISVSLDQELQSSDDGQIQTSRSRPNFFNDEDQDIDPDMHVSSALAKDQLLIEKEMIISEMDKELTKTKNAVGALKELMRYKEQIEFKRSHDNLQKISRGYEKKIKFLEDQRQQLLSSIPYKVESMLLLLKEQLHCELSDTDVESLRLSATILQSELEESCKRSDELFASGKSTVHRDGIRDKSSDSLQVSPLVLKMQARKSEDNTMPHDQHNKDCTIAVCNIS
jgi:hypothetical protein